MFILWGLKAELIALDAADISSIRDALSSFESSCTSVAPTRMGTSMSHGKLESFMRRTRQSFRSRTSMVSFLRRSWRMKFSIMVRVDRLLRGVLCSGCSKSSAAGLRREREVRRTLLYAAMTRDAYNEWVFSSLQAENL